MPKPRTVFVDVYIDNPDPLRFRVVQSPKNDPQLPTKANGDLIFENDEHPGFDIHFELQGDTHGYFFPHDNDKKKAVWSQFGTDCPTGPQGVWDVFKPVRTVHSPCNPPEIRTLIVHNRNANADGDFMYNLRVVNGAGDWLPLDPGGTNTNGPSSPLVNYLAVGGIAVTTGVLSALATVVLARPLFCS